MKNYILELVVTEEGAPFYHPVGMVEKLTSDNAGYDLKVVRDVVPAHKAVLVPLGVRGRLCDHEGNDCHYTLEPRSSIYKTGFMMANSRGIIDKTYRGELMAPMVSVSESSVISAGSRMFQIVAPDLGWIREVHYVASLPPTVRGANGFGSTGN